MSNSNSELKSIQKKLMAAICMVLVASIMVVSSSYAWFTLSTAPEVKGIQTSVGSNGNLEMALREVADLNSITSTSTAGGTFPDANTYWGNLVDLSSSTYHLDQLALAPARLNAQLNAAGSTATDTQKTDSEGNLLYIDNITGAETTSATDADGKSNTPAYEYAVEAYQLNGKTFLQTPVYGVDGRLSGLTANGVINGTYVEASNGFGGSGYGIRAVGTSSSMTPEEMALRTAQQTVSSAITNSKTAATLSLRDDSINLANIYVMGILNAGHTFTNTDVASVQTAVTNLQKIVTELDNALDQAVIAVAVSQKLSVATVTYDSGTITAYDANNTAVAIDWTSETLSAAQTDLIKAYGTLSTMQGLLTSAKTELDKLTDDEHTYNEMTAAVTALLDSDDFEINGYTMTAFKQLDVVTQAGIIFGIPTISIVGGIYYNVAEFSGNYSAKTTMTVPDGTYMDKVTLEEPKDIEVNMVTAANEPSDNGYYLNYISNWLAALEVDTEGSSATTVITDIYGYAIDLAFRTNAKGSSLLLQTEAANRVSSDSGDLTQGSGSYMEFTSGHADFTIEQVANLMESVRVVFIDDNGNILGVAALEVPETIEETATSVKAPLYMYKYTISNGILELDGKDTSGIISALTQNTAMGVTALVYLDGDTVENADVAISGSSMTGTMNLQFASSAELDPMDYTFTAEQLKEPTVSFDTTSNKLTITAAADAPTGTKYEVYTTISGVEYVLHDGVAAGEYTVSMDGVTAPAGDYDIYVRAVLTGYTDSNAVKATTITVADTSSDAG